MSKNLYMQKIGEKAKTASLNLSNLNINKKNSVLKQFSYYLKTNEQLILNANKKDISNAKSKKTKDSMIDRLKLNSKKIIQIRSAIKKIIKFREARFAFLPIFSMYKFLDIFILSPNHPYE